MRVAPAVYSTPRRCTKATEQCLGCRALEFQRYKYGESHLLVLLYVCTRIQTEKDLDSGYICS